MGVTFDDRAKEKKFLAHYWSRADKKKVNIGMFATLEEANAALDAKYAELNIPRPKEKKVEKKEVNLKFGMVPKG